ncbi:hypothetical protein [Vreelandella olivaria]|uniref:hypothetical protein n=1 Tax=Vreelandella olivaria TaxID=390919 RepID=UPI00201F959E|nr:hypothetical protein [Halomonas olivaria]
MFAYQECLDSLKYLAKNSIRTDLSYCQRLDFYSCKFGFNNYHHFQKTMPKLPTDRFGKVSLRLMRQYCQTARPGLDMAYYELYAEKGPKIAFYSHWVGWDKIGREVREPRPLDAQKSIDGLRELFVHPIYIVENHRQLLGWLHNWYGTALVPQTLAKYYFPEKFDRKRLVCDHVDIKLIRACNEDYNNNVAT